MLLSEMLPDIAGQGTTNTGIALVAVSVVCFWAVNQATDKRVTLAVCTATAVTICVVWACAVNLANGFEQVSQHGVKLSFDDQPHPVTGMHLDGRGHGDMGVATREDIEAWSEARDGFTHAAQACDGVVYSRRRIGEECRRHQPRDERWDCAREAWSGEDKWVLACRSSDGRPQTARSLYMPNRWNSSYEYAEMNAAAKAKGEGTGETGITAGGFDLSEIARGTSMVNDAFDWQMTTYCLSHAQPPSAGGDAIQRSVDARCYGSSWWGDIDPFVTRGPLTAGEEWSPDAAVFNGLGEGVALDSKQLFCLCEMAPEFQRWLVTNYVMPVQVMAGILLFLFIISLITFFMLFCCFEDSDKYYDPDLL